MKYKISTTNVFVDTISVIAKELIQSIFELIEIDDIEFFSTNFHERMIVNRNVFIMITFFDYKSRIFF